MLTRRLVPVALAVAALLCAPGAASPARAKTVRQAPDYVPGQIVVGYAPATEIAHTAGHQSAAADASAGTSAEDSVRIVKVARGRSIWPAITKLRGQRGVRYAVPDYI